MAGRINSIVEGAQEAAAEIDRQRKEEILSAVKSLEDILLAEGIDMPFESAPEVRTKLAELIQIQQHPVFSREDLERIGFVEKIARRFLMNYSALPVSKSRIMAIAIRSSLKRWKDELRHINSRVSKTWALIVDCRCPIELNEHRRWFFFFEGAAFEASEQIKYLEKELKCLGK